MLNYLLRGQAHRAVFRLLWGNDATGNVSELARRAGVSFSAVHRELESMRKAGLAVCERLGGEVRYHAKADHPQATLLRQLGGLPDQAVDTSTLGLGQPNFDDVVRSWLGSVGAPLGAPTPTTPVPQLEEVLAEAVKLSHRDSTVARTLPVTLWRRRSDYAMDRLVEEATRRDERQALGYFLELAGTLGGDATLVSQARRLRDRRRSKPRMFFEGRARGRYAAALTRKRTPKAALRWCYLMNMDLDSFRSQFDKFADAP
jgi:DNA-binding transcriptional ArsR family regulator